MNKAHSDRLRLGFAVITGVLVLTVLGYLSLAPLSAIANEATSYLVVIGYDDQDDLQRLSSLELDLLDWRVGCLTAIVVTQELIALRSMGFDVRILDAPATPELYYLVEVPPTEKTTPLFQHTRVFPYVEGVFILKAGPAEAELLAVEGFFIQKLLGPIVLPTSSSLADLDASTVSIQGYDPLIQNLFNSVSQTQIYTTILNLQDDDLIPGWDTERSRYSYAPELADERDYIRDRMLALGLDVRYHGFSLGSTPLDNVEGTLIGWGPGSDVVYIVCAHYDSFSNDAYNTAPGADDNASGTAAVLEAARILSQYRYRHTLRFVTFAAEEQGLFGSYYYAAEAYSNGTDIGGVINHDMNAWDSDGDDVMEIHAGTRSDSQALGTAFLNANTIYGNSLVPKYITIGSSTRSDHARFWNQGYPAIMVIEDHQDYNPHYHQTSDTLDKLNLPYATKFVQTTVATLAELAEIIPPGVNIEHTGPVSATSGTLTELTIQYANPGPDPATSVVITDTLGPGLTYVTDNGGFTITQPASDVIVWQVGNVAPYSRNSFVVTTSVEAALPDGTNLTSTVEITGVTNSDDPGDNQSVWTGVVEAYIQYLPVIFKNSD